MKTLNSILYKILSIELKKILKLAYFESINFYENISKNSA